LKIAAIRPAPELQAKAGYTLTILSDAPNASGAARFASFLLSAKGYSMAWMSSNPL
jgi:molybdate/tungstate transport system substrate-binding protein